MITKQFNNNYGYIRVSKNYCRVTMWSIVNNIPKIVKTTRKIKVNTADAYSSFVKEIKNYPSLGYEYRVVVNSNGREILSEFSGVFNSPKKALNWYNTHGKYTWKKYKLKLHIVNQKYSII